MTEQNNSFQVVLEPEQYETLAQLASKQNRTISDVNSETQPKRVFVGFRSSNARLA
jgi:cell division protein ZapA (FtsZ GTPase activity inhibitor)